MKKAGVLILSTVVCALLCGHAEAQAPAGSAPAANEEATGMTLNTSFNGSIDSGSHVYDWTTTTGYILNKHFSTDLGVPFLFVRGADSAGTTTSNSGLGNVFGQLQFADKNPLVNFGAVGTVALPTGDSSKGLSTGHVTFDLTGQLAKELGRFTPFVSAGIGNSLFDSRYWQRPYMTFGDLAHFEGGTSFDLGLSLTVSASLYDVAPWGSQKIYSKLVRKGTSGGGTASHGRLYQNNAITSGDSSIDKDNGINADLDFNPWKYVDFDFAYTHSVHFQLDTLSFGVGLNLSSLLRRGGSSKL